MMDFLSKVSWWRVLIATMVTYLASFILTVALILVYTLFAIWQEPSNGTSVDWFSGGVGTWSIPVLTFFAAAWAARKAEPPVATLHGLVVGLLVALVFGLIFFWPFNLATLMLFVLMVVSGSLGGVIGAGFLKRGGRSSL